MRTASIVGTILGAAINNWHNVRIIAASQFNQHERETSDVRVLFTPY
jgi:hypothetical protein